MYSSLNEKKENMQKAERNGEMASGVFNSTTRCPNWTNHSHYRGKDAVCVRLRKAHWRGELGPFVIVHEVLNTENGVSIIAVSEFTGLNRSSEWGNKGAETKCNEV